MSDQGEARITARMREDYDDFATMLHQVESALKRLPYTEAEKALSSTASIDAMFRLALGGDLEIGEPIGQCMSCERTIFEWPEDDGKWLDIDGELRACPDCYPAEHAKIVEHLRLHPEDGAYSDDPAPPGSNLSEANAEDR